MNTKSIKLSWGPLTILVICLACVIGQEDESTTTEKPKWTWPPWLTLPSSLPTIPPGWTDWTPGGPFPTLPPGVTLVPPEWIEDAKVEIDDLGTIQGAVSFTSPVTAPTRRKFFWFSGIPYADPESYTGANRFKPSALWQGQLPKNQNGVFAAINPLIWCPQHDILPLTTDLGEVLTAYRNRSRIQRARRNGGIKPQAQGVESCLVVNVNTPKLPTKDTKDEELLPVILFIHGGSFDGMFGGVFGGHRLLNRDVVVVTINYRLGVLGTLNLGIDQAPGNAAMYDVITALKWIKKYIGFFGGDKNRVTVSGHSAGAVMASHLLTSKLVIDDDKKLLINGIIGLSGSSLSQWATCKDPLTHNLRVSKFAGCYNETESHSKSLTNEELEKIRNCMADKEIPDLISAMDRYVDAERLEGRLGYDARVPSIQNSMNLNIPAFLDDNPYDIIKRGEEHDIPIMMGATKHDGTFVLEDTLYDFLEPNNYTNDAEYMRNEFLPTLLGAIGVDDPSGEMVHSLMHTYLGESFWADDFKSKIPGLIDIHSVIGFKAGGYNLVEMHSKLNPHSYYFSFEYDGLWSVDGGDDIPGGVGHVDSIFYIFQAFPLIVPRDQAVAYRFTDYWANFAICGNPNGDGTLIATAAPYNGLNHPYLIIDKFDSTGYYCRDSWINNSLTLMKPEPTTPTTKPTTTTVNPTKPSESTVESQPTAGETTPSEPTQPETPTTTTPRATTSRATELNVSIIHIFVTIFISTVLRIPFIA